MPYRSCEDDSSRHSRGRSPCESSSTRSHYHSSSHRRSHDKRRSDYNSPGRRKHRTDNGDDYRRRRHLYESSSSVRDKSLSTSRRDRRRRSKSRSLSSKRAKHDGGIKSDKIKERHIRDEEHRKKEDDTIRKRDDELRKRDEENRKKERLGSQAQAAEKRRWKFDSPPREHSMCEGVGSGTGLVPTSSAGVLVVNGVPGQISHLLINDLPKSAMGVLAQSIGLSSEQQKTARELYVGNIPPSYTINQLIDFFNQAMVAINVSGLPGPPVARIWMADEGRFGFIEMRTIEEATIALQLNGLVCSEYSLRVGRPKTYPSDYASLLSSTAATDFSSDTAAAALAAATAAAASVSSNQPSTLRVAHGASSFGMFRRPDRPERLVLLEFPSNSKMSSEEIHKLLVKHGVLKVFQYFEVPSEKSGRLKGACIIEYADLGQQKAFEKAVKERELNGLKLRLMPAAEAVHDERIAEAMLKARSQDERGEELMRPQVPTRVIMLENLVTRSELLDEQEYLDILDDVNSECAQYGKVSAVDIPRPIPGAQAIQDDTDIGYAFVKFAKLQDAGTARKALSGRKFAGRTVEAHYFSEVKFKSRDFHNPKPNFDLSGRTLASPSDTLKEGTTTTRFDIAPPRAN